MAYNCDLNIH